MIFNSKIKRLSPFLASLTEGVILIILQAKEQNFEFFENALELYLEVIWELFSASIIYFCL